jgi:GDPmannose 4,6-dehydratase
MAKAIIFGASGQDGVLLAEFLRKKGLNVVLVSRSMVGATSGNVADYEFVGRVIRIEKPDFIFHFAANSSTKHDFLFENHAAISTGALNILEAVRLHSPSCKVFLSGSALQFVNRGLPINESTPFEGGSPYSIARIQSVYAARYYRSEFNLKVYVGYLFNHDSPLRNERHINQKIISAIKSIISGQKLRVEVGNVDVMKEFNYAGDVVRAIWILINQDNIYEAVIGSGKAHSIKEWLEYCFGKFNMDWQDYVDANPNFNSEYEILVSDPSLIKKLGWQPEVDFRGLANLMIAQ